MRSVFLRELSQNSDRMIFGTISEVYRTCGQPGCRCKRGGPKHGPFVQISYHGPSGKTTGYHVPRKLIESVREGVEAWHRFLEFGRELADLNRQQLWEVHKEAKRKH